MKKHVANFVVSAVAFVAAPALFANAFRVSPYVQRPQPTAMSILWLAQTNGAASVSYWPTATPAAVTTLNAVERKDLSSDVTGLRFAANDNTLEYCHAPELGYNCSPESGDNTKNRYNAWTMSYTTPWQYRVRLTGLAPDTSYGYRVELEGTNYVNTFRTPPTRDPKTWKNLKFIYFSDSETEPKDNDASSGLTGDWSKPGSVGENGDRTYYVTQTAAYRQNLVEAQNFGAELIVMAGDLAQKGSKQCDWDEFWRHNAGPLNDPAGSIPILASPGNHDYWSYNDGGECGIKKFMSYLEVEPNDAGVDADQRERFHRVDYGPATFIFLDANNGDDSDHERDTNLSMKRGGSGTGSGCRAPDFNPGSLQYQWLERQLQDAQKKSAFTFIVSHHCPFSVGYHGQKNYVKSSSEKNTDNLSGRPLRVLLPMLHKYGVAAWLAGHDEMMEHSVHTGVVERVDGTTAPHAIQVWDMGIAGDGLRGNMMITNEYEVFRADWGAPEVWSGKKLVSGGKHYGHMAVSITKTPTGAWEAKFEPVYLFANNVEKSGATKFAGTFTRCIYNDVVTLTNTVSSAIDPATYHLTAAPSAVLQTFADGPDTRGFSWETDGTVTTSKLWLLAGEHGAADAALFLSAGQAFVGTSADRTETNTAGGTIPLRLHKVQATGLAAGTTYSYRLGDGGANDVYGTFTTAGAEPKSVTVVTVSDAQARSADKVATWANTMKRAAEQVGGATNVDFVLSVGDVYDVNYMYNVDAQKAASGWVSNTWYGVAFEKYYFNYLKWGMDVDAATAHFPDVPWVLASGNHDGLEYWNGSNWCYDYCTAANYSAAEKCKSFDYGDVHFVILPCLSSGDNASLYAGVKTWLQADLAANRGKKKWTVAAIHWGPYTTGDHGINAQSQTLVTMLAPVFSAGHVDLVIQAHDHTYSKTLPYRWDTDGYTTTRNNSAIINSDGAEGTYYVAAGCAGHRVGEDGDTYAGKSGSQSYDTKRTYKVVTGTLALDSAYGKKGDDASSNPSASMFGVLKATASTLTYDWYVVATNGLESAVHYDTLTLTKQGTSARGMSVVVR